MDCIFCKIAAHDIPAQIIYEDNEIISFFDISPFMEFHALIIPKKHIPSVSDCPPEDWPLVHKLIDRAKLIAEEHHLSGYKLHFNVNAAGGQVVPHVHLHLMAGQILKHEAL